MTRIRKHDLFATLPPEWPGALVPPAPEGATVVVLDDDPTGTQTVHGVPVLTGWSVEALATELAAAPLACYVLTNSRSLPPTEAAALNAEVGRNLLEAGRSAGRAFVVVSRSDSTLRGHFPAEVDALAEALGGGFDATLLIPCFHEGGRYTLNDTHYVAEGEWLVPAGETAFARDASFGYQASNLRAWVAEKSGGRVQADAVASVSIDDIRLGGPARVAERLLALAPGSVCVVNAASPGDLAVFVAGLREAEAAGRRFLYRTAASFVPLRAGIAPRPLLRKNDLELPAQGGGLVVVGSYVPTTSAQVEALLALPDIVAVSVEVAALLEPDQRALAIDRAARQVEQALGQGRDVALITSRTLVTGTDAESSLAIGRAVSSGLVAITQAIAARPRYLLAKGGITSSDVATAGMGVRRALVLGQILPGVPVWRLGAESRHPGLAYIVFPGNVGHAGSVAEVVQALRG